MKKLRVRMDARKWGKVLSFWGKYGDRGSNCIGVELESHTSILTLNEAKGLIHILGEHVKRVEDAKGGENETKG